jgi:hypothetical protein
MRAPHSGKRLQGGAGADGGAMMCQLVGATAAGSAVKRWTAEGGKVLLKSKAVPIKRVIDSRALSLREAVLLELARCSGSEEPTISKETP